VPLSEVKAMFASLVNARPSEISYVPSTTTGENLVVAGLGLPGGKAGNVVTDALHFEGSLYLYQSLQRERGLGVRIVTPREGRVALRDLERAIDRDTKLVAISLVSYLNGFQHDLKAVCDLAHAHGAYVYADAVQAAGAIPIDVRASGVDFLASSSYKWLMADLGIGFLYVREELLDRVVRRVQYSFRQIDTFEYHILPGDPPGDGPVTWTRKNDAGGHFEVGTWSTSTIAALSHSLPFILRTGVDRIQAHNLALARRVRAELPRLGYALLTPPESPSSISTFTVADHDATARRLAAAKVDVSLYPRRVRIAPSIYNSDRDVDVLLEALG
jgi:selenocysteine lyase/cysteine desulfurase